MNSKKTVVIVLIAVLAALGALITLNQLGVDTSPFLKTWGAVGSRIFLVVVGATRPSGP